MRHNTITTILGVIGCCTTLAACGTTGVTASAPPASAELRPRGAPPQGSPWRPPVDYGSLLSDRGHAALVASVAIGFSRHA
jgi:hypothetical protein